MGKAVMLQGTGSHVGKSILATALCRIFKQDGYSVAPFKAQNMALNSYVTKAGGEMGRAQVAQAEACGLEPQVEMNPILLKPTGNASSQVIVLGKPVGNLSAQEYHNSYNTTALDIVKDSYDKLSNQYEIVVLEGAGSPAEVNLKARDIVNMRMAKLAKAPVLLVADIDRGGALAAVVGTLALLEPDEVTLIEGIIINKFRGDIRLLEPALSFLEEKTGKPVLGVIPMLPNLGIADEDSVARENDDGVKSQAEGVLDIAVISLPKISNFTDFDCFAEEGDIALRYVKEYEKLGQPDLIIIPGSKNTLEDLLFLYHSGLAYGIKKLAELGIPVVGICGGYQILGEYLTDPFSVETSAISSLPGLGLLPIKTVFAEGKITRQVTGSLLTEEGPLLKNCKGLSLTGYEIHMGQSTFSAQITSLAQIQPVAGDSTQLIDGAVSANGLVIGTYLHGIFDDDKFRRQFLNNLRSLKAWEELDATGVGYFKAKEQAYDRLASHVRQYLDMEKLYAILEKYTHD